MKINTDNVTFNFDKNNAPAVTVKLNETIEVQTKDCFSNQLRSPEDTFDQLDWDITNPATGPIFIEGVEPGDTLKVTIGKINLDNQGTVCCLENEGALGHIVEGAHFKIVKVEDGCAVFSDEIKIPLKPMIGVIGVAPADGAVNTGTPADHGGNMDNTMIGENTTLYFPVAAEGALFSIGDVHAVMGDGEIGVSGLEIPAEIELTFDVVKGRTMPCPVLENEEYFSVIASKPTLDEASVYATEMMHKFITERTDMSTPDTVMLMSLAGDCQFCQIVDPQKTVRFVMAKKYLKGVEF